jgi:hypothetical protein
MNLALALIITAASFFAGSKTSKSYTKDETLFIANVSRIAQESPKSISRNTDGTITVDFTNTYWVLAKDGTVEEVWEMDEQGNWVTYGSEQACY